MMLDHLADPKMVAAASWHVFTHRTFSRRLREDFEDFARSNAVVLLLVVDLVDHAEQPAVAAIQRRCFKGSSRIACACRWQPTIPRWEGSVHLKTVGGYVFVVAAKSGVCCSSAALPAAFGHASFEGPDPTVEQSWPDYPRTSAESCSVDDSSRGNIGSLGSWRLRPEMGSNGSAGGLSRSSVICPSKTKHLALASRCRWLQRHRMRQQALERDHSARDSGRSRYRVVQLRPNRR